MKPTYVELVSLRTVLEGAFAPDTAGPVARENAPGTTASAGHCAVVAILVNSMYGGEFVSAYVQGVSHWYNRLTMADGAEVDVDLCGDQFGFPAVQMTRSMTLYGLHQRVRYMDELRAETWDRAEKFAARCGVRLTNKPEAMS